MRSAIPKPLHRLCGQPMIDYAIDAAAIPALDQTIIVLSPALNASDTLLAHLQDRLGDRLGVAIQHDANGTGDALRCAIPLIHAAGAVIVLFADHPLLTSERMGQLSESLRVNRSTISLLTCVLDDAAGYGRIERDDAGRIRRIVERKDDQPEKRAGRIEINSGMMAVDVAWLRGAADRFTPSPVTGEIYLTQLVELAIADELTVSAIEGDAEELAGVNDRADLASAESILQSRIQSAHLRNGVTLVAPGTTVIEQGVEVGSDTTILPGCLIRAGTVIGSGCEIGPHTVLTGARIGDRCRITSSHITNSEIRSDSDVGPSSHIRDGALIESGVHIGNFAEIKNSRVQPGVRVGHFSYLGDASIGERTNIGAGTVTVNFDGVNKHQTKIGSDVFIGSDTMLIAPISVGDGAMTGAGSVVTRNVPSGDKVVGVPARSMKKSQARDGQDR